MQYIHYVQLILLMPGQSSEKCLSDGKSILQRVGRLPSPLAWPTPLRRLRFLNRTGRICSRINQRVTRIASSLPQIEVGDILEAPSWPCNRTHVRIMYITAHIRSVCYIMLYYFMLYDIYIYCTY